MESFGRSKRFALLAVSVFIVTAGVFGAAGCKSKESGGKIKVAASIVPIGDFCRNVGGDLVEVQVMVPPGASPHTFEPTSDKMMFLSDAGVFVYNGLDLEGWVTDFVEKVDNGGLVEVAASGIIPKADLIDASRGDGEGIYDPHVWLDPKLAELEVEAIRDGFIEADPVNAASYRENARRYIEELRDLDRYIGEKTGVFTKRKFVSFHPAFTYFAHHYGLEQVGVIEELPGREPGAGEIAELVDTIKAEGVQVVFTEPQFSPKAAETIAAESGAEVVLKTLDPIGNPDDPEADTYIKLMKHNTAVMEEAMR